MLEAENTEMIEEEIVDEEIEKKPGFWAWLADVTTTLVIIAVFVLIIRVFLFSPFHVSGPSMCNTINFIDGECRSGYGEYIIVNKAVYLNVFNWEVGSSERNDIVVFKPEYEDAPYLIKRIIGLPGDEVTIKGGRVYLQKPEETEPVLLDEYYLNSQNLGNTSVLSSKQERIYKVPEGKYFVMGDNRAHSTDSRTCFGRSVSQCTPESEITFVPKDNITGKAWITLWPFSKIRFLSDL